MPALPDNDPDKWQYSQHAKVKHELLAKYLMPWAMITSSGMGKALLTYVDGFAGRGQYEDADGLVTAGSPIIALQQAPSWLKYSSRVSLHFVERDPDNFANLASVINQREPIHQDVQVTKWNKPFAGAVDDILAQTPFRTPAFFMIDPFGFGGVPFDVVKRILTRPRAEIFFTLMVRDMAHYLTAPNAEASLTELFGTQDWKAIAQSGQDRELGLRDLYIEQVRKIAQTPYIWTFRVCMDETYRTLYYLVHVANHWKGVKLMKEVMYNQGGQGIPGTFAFLGPQDVASKTQLSLFHNPEDVQPLQDLLIRHFKGRKSTFLNCMAETIHLENNISIEKHYRQALKDLEDTGIVRVRRVTSKTQRGLNGNDEVQFPD